VLTDVQQALDLILKADKGQLRIEAKDHKIVYIEHTIGKVISRQ
jgi:hypothetical protein